ncbi:MAG: hypothetical protein Tsb002_15030 [Wenzhouxiangellaceae bacterium]
MIKIRTFGAMRDYADNSGYIDLASEAATVAQLRSDLDQWLRQHHGAEYSPALLASCVFANDQQLLAEDSPLTAAMPLAVLPPVAGG